MPKTLRCGGDKCSRCGGCRSHSHSKSERAACGLAGGAAGGSLIAVNGIAIAVVAASTGIGIPLAIGILGATAATTGIIGALGGKTIGNHIAEAFIKECNC